MSEEKKFQTKKSLGQHFLNSPVVPSWMCDAANLEAGETVVEVGPGTGVLTAELLQRDAHVIALEADERAITVLKEKFAPEITSGQLTVRHEDARTFSLASLNLPNHGFKIVANIPYYLSGLLFRSYLGGVVQPKELVFLVQKEVAKRITTDLERGEKESLLSLSVKVYGEPTYIKTVSKGHFSPPPKIDSAIIAIRNINRTIFNTVDHDRFFDYLHLGFGQKRKQLLGNLAAEVDRDQLINIFQQVGIAENIRAEDLPLETWLRLVQELSHSNP